MGALSGAAEFNLTSLVKTAGMDDVVTHLPPVAAPELAGWYRSTDVVVMPFYSESFGLVALEAQACGSPVLATRVGGLSRAVSDGRTGLLVDGHMAADWADALEVLYDDPVMRQDMGRAAAVEAESSGWQRTAAITHGSYRTAAHQHSARSELLALKTRRRAAPLPAFGDPFNRATH